MIELIVTNHGEFMEALGFDNLELLKSFLSETENVDAIFGWILGEEPDAILPDFTSAETADDIAAILAEYDYTFWTVTLEESFQRGERKIDSPDTFSGPVDVLTADFKNAYNQAARVALETDSQWAALNEEVRRQIDQTGAYYYEIPSHETKSSRPEVIRF